MRARALRACGLAVLAVSASGCFDFAEPSELVDTQLLGVRAEPKAIGAGERARLDFIAGGPGGIVEGGPATWTVVSAIDFPAIGSIELEGDEVFYRAPADQSEPAVATVQIDVTIDGETMTALKAIGVGLAETPNPRLTSLTLAGAEVDPQMPVVANSVSPLSAELEPADPEMAQIAWYTTVGELDPIRGPETALTVEPDATSGPLVVVGRDGLGGIDWRVVELVVE